MQMKLALALGCVALVGTTSLATTEAVAKTAKKKPAPRPRARFEGWDQGGAVGRPNGAAPAAPSLTKAWLIGTWVPATKPCVESEAMRFHPDGRYSWPYDSGTFAVAGPAEVRFSYRDIDLAPGELATADMERSAPLKSRLVDVVRGPDNDRLRLIASWWRRCSTDPDAQLS